jgi:hypothetical protein
LNLPSAAPFDLDQLERFIKLSSDPVGPSLIVVVMAIVGQDSLDQLSTVPGDSVLVRDGVGILAH